MSWPHILIYVVVIGVGLPSAWRNPTAGGLVAAWAIGETAWMLSGNSLPLKVYFMADIAVMAVMFWKATRREACRTYHSLREQLKCFGRAMTLWDRWIAASYILAVWPIYVSELHPYYKWWALYWILIAQFILAAGEAIQSLLGDRRVTVSKPPGGPGLAYARGGGRV